MKRLILILLTFIGLSVQAQELVVYDARDVEGYWGRRGGKYYLVDLLSGREQGSFTFSKRDRENIFFDVNITWFK